jgi:hypothetical protein
VTTFQWAIRDGLIDARSSLARDGLGEVARLSFGPGARITRLNKGLRRRKDKAELGFWIDPISGYWKAAPEEDGPKDPTMAPFQLIVPCVRDHKNALLVLPTVADPTEETLPTLQHALLRGIESTFQLEEGELLAEPLPSREDRRGFLLYEATEGGAGVLSRLVAEEGTLARVARAALAILHYRLPDDGSLPGAREGLVEEADARCVAGCYRCLLSYYNQPDHPLIDRRDPAALALLLRLAACWTEASTSGAPRLEETGALGNQPWRAALASRGLPLPDAEPLDPGAPSTTPGWRDHFVAATLAGVPESTRQRLADLGFALVSFEDQADWPAAFDRLAPLLGVNR